MLSYRICNYSLSWVCSFLFLTICEHNLSLEDKEILYKEEAIYSQLSIEKKKIKKTLKWQFTVNCQ